MAKITLKGNPIKTDGDLPAVGNALPDFRLVKTDLSEVTRSDFAGKTLVLNIFPSIDTPVCQAAARRFNQVASDREDTVVLSVSMDLPFAHSRFCEAEGLENVIPLSTFRSPEFGRDFGVAIADGPIRGLLSRAIVVADPEGRVLYTEQVPEIGQEPDYDAALAALN